MNENEKTVNNEIIEGEARELYSREYPIPDCEDEESRSGKSVILGIVGAGLALGLGAGVLIKRHKNKKNKVSEQNDSTIDETIRKELEKLSTEELIDLKDYLEKKKETVEAAKEELNK